MESSIKSILLSVLPGSAAQNEMRLKELALRHGFNLESLTVEQLRVLTVELLQDTFTELKDSAS